VLALGKDSNAYLVNRNNLGGITSPVAQANVSGTNRGISAVAYHTSQGTYFALHNDSGAIRAYKITPTNPPTIVFAWSQNQNGRGSPWVTTTDGTNNTIVWYAATGDDQRVHAYDGDTGAVIYTGGGTNELMTGTRQWNTGIAARGRIYFGADNKIYAFRLPTGTPTHPPFFNGETALGGGWYYLQFSNGTPFGYYSYLGDPRFIYHFDMGYEYWFDANDGHSGIFFYDFMSNHFFYTSPSFPFPYLYDFSLNTILYYYPDLQRPGHYTTNPRYFYDFATHQIITR